jgi:hypothetical protein
MNLEKHFVTQGKEGYHGDAYNRYVDRASKSRNREVAMHFPNGLGIHHAGMLLLAIVSSQNRCLRMGLSRFYAAQPHLLGHQPACTYSSYQGY